MGISALGNGAWVTNGKTPETWLHWLNRMSLVFFHSYFTYVILLVLAIAAVIVFAVGRREMPWAQRFSWWSHVWEHKWFWFQYVSRNERQTFIYTGLPGSGKTMVGLVRDGIQAMRQGALVGANFTVQDPLTGRKAIPVSSWLDVLGLAVEALETNEDVLILIDEGHNWADARLWQATTKFAPWLFYLLAQKRHYGIGLEFSTQALKQMEVRIRDLVDGVVMCEPVRWIKWISRGKMPVYRLTLYRPNIDVDEMEDEHGMPTKWIWAPVRARFGYSTTELVATEDFSKYDDEGVKATIRQFTERAIAAAKVQEIAVFGCLDTPFENEWSALRGRMVEALWADER
jgi:hypothetical protein